MKKSLLYLTFFVLLILGCSKEDVETPEASADLKGNSQHAEAEIAAVLTDIFAAIDQREIETLLAFHAYGPMFTDFKDGLPRTGSEGNEASERALVDMISSFDYDLNDLQIDVLSGTVAKVTFHADFRPTIQGVEYQQLAQGTLIFVKVKGDWKIIHEHLSPLAPPV